MELINYQTRGGAGRERDARQVCSHGNRSTGSRTEHPHLGPTPTRLGHPAELALQYPLGDGTDPQPWTTFQHLARHLKQT
ncbi:DUF6177 family protein [Streptomyces sp. WAC00263]|uniref:DUF6177 family protein n=1 Tax=Streptomyces sp. WAC00263 TaxID=1917422 RepID=UPI001F508BA2|nr:DUF6177 family protein [Streptomyces sp. WAC00263]